MRTLLIDNYDSYTYNLFQLMAVAYGEEPIVLSNDEQSWESVRNLDVDAIVISPGPGHPAEPRNLGICGDIVRYSERPVLGVCLGHQAIGLLHGAAVTPAPQPRHGHLTRIEHGGTELFDGIPQGFTGVRYHSLCVPAAGLPDDLVATAWAEDGVVMGLRHRTRPLWGVQFHPESVATEHGERLLANFGRLVSRTRPVRRDNRPRRHQPAAPARRRPAWQIRYRRLDRAVDSAHAFQTLFDDHQFAFWLDSSRVEEGLSRFSFLGAPDGPEGEVLRYDLGTGAVVTSTSSPLPEPAAGSVFDVLRDRLAERAVRSAWLPFDLTCGYVGYLGYELKAELGSSNRHLAPTPDAAWMSATRMVAVDHRDNRTYLLALCRTNAPASVAAADDWLASTTATLTAPNGVASAARADGTDIDPEPWLARRRHEYTADVEECQRQLHAGESYEICLTTSLSVPLRADPLSLYLCQRRHNPAPYAAFLRIDDFAVLCSSPERFLRIDRDRMVESKPIKGTTPRDADPERDAALRDELATSAKTRAENLMIVDLIRNDLGRVCDVGTVDVAKFMHVESYATVHQLVSTVRGRLRPGVTAIDCVRACFPGGSMTGAPKLRTMEIIDRLETGPRGVYSGTLGFFGLNGTADLNIVIRTAVARDGRLSIGAGGAIVLDSDPDDEYEEMLLKARAPLRGLLTPDRALPAHAPTVVT